MNKKREAGIFATAVILLALLSCRIMYISFFKHNQYTKAINAQAQATVEIQKVRGNIYDRNMIPFTNRNTKVLCIGKGGEISDSGNVSIYLPNRYTTSGFAAHALGTVSEDGDGMSGIEKIYDSTLKSDNSYYALYKADGAGVPYAGQNVVCKKGNSSKPSSLKLTLDYHIQKIAENVANEHIERGAVVILDAQSFDVLAMVSRPDFDPSNVGVYMNSANSELLNRAMCQYNAGSVFKIVTAAAFLDSGEQYLSSSYFCSGNSEIDGRVFNCHKSDGHGFESFYDGFANSCNCVFYETGLRVGGEKIYEYAKKLGLGEKVLFFGDEEARGNITCKKNYTPLETANLSIGQGDILITPLQCAAVAATVANGGVRKNVNIADSVTDGDDNPVLSLRKSQSVRTMKETTAASIGAMMRQCVVSGTAKDASSSCTNIAGKTGSAETGWIQSDGSYSVHGWFCGFFPYDNPKYAMAVFCENGKSGADSCVEPFVEICEEINKIYPFKQ